MKLVLALVWTLSSTVFSQNITHDTDYDLAKVVEYDQIKGSCDKYFKLLNKDGRLKKENQGTEDAARLEVLCGKWIFFYLEAKSNIGIPEALLRSLKFYFKEDIGESYSKWGFYPDPVDKGQALGVIKTKPHNKRFKDLMVPAQRQISCAGCHVGKLPDGRYSVGMPNEILDISLFNKYMVFPLWLVSKEKENEEKFHPELIALYKNLREKMKSAPRHFPNTLDMSVISGKLMPSSWMYNMIQQYPPSLGDQVSYVNGRPGVFNAASPLISFGDRDFYTSIPPIWGLTHEKGNEKLAYLGTITSAPYLEAFIKHAFVYTTYTDDYSVDKYVTPLAAYLRTLKAPKFGGTLKRDLVNTGKLTFEAKCQSCHDGPHGESSFRVDIKDVGTPWQLSGIFNDYVDPNFQSKRLLDGLQSAFPFETITEGIKSRRLNGIWARKLLMTNGSIDGLDHLFCLNGKSRNETKREALTQYVHEDLCHLSENEKLSLKEYLLTF